MASWFRVSVTVAALAGFAAALGGCLVPPEGPSIFDNRPDRRVGPSSQRTDEDGYPLLGAYPGQAAPQLDSAAVASDRASLSAAAAAQNGQVRSAAAEYQQSVNEAAAIRRRHEADAAALGTPRAQSGAGKAETDDVLREIEGR